MSTTGNSRNAFDGKENIKEVTRTSHRKRAKANDTAGRQEPRTKSTVRKTKTGRLSQLMSIPMDVLMEIFGHLHPLDLLHLARTTKAFRRVLMHKSSLFVWKAALFTIPGLPDCPPELSEPQWTNLAFDTHCSSCSRPNIRTVDWTLRIRLCIGCTTSQITNTFDHFLDKGSYPSVTIAVPVRLGRRARLEFLKDEYDRVDTQYHAIEDPDAREAFVAERKEAVKRINEHAKLCVAWANSQALVRSGELDRLRSSRRQAIVDKLVALGWGDEIDKIAEDDALANHKLVKVPQLLTDRIWANISGPIIEYMETMKSNRLARELAQLYKQRKLEAIKLLRRYKTERAPFTDVMPELLDFYAFDPIEEILDQPPEINVDSGSFLHVVPQLDGLVEEWRRTIIAEFIQEVKFEVNSPNVDDNPLDLDGSILRQILLARTASDESTLHRIRLARTVFGCVPCKNIRAFETDDVRPVTVYSPTAILFNTHNTHLFSRSPQTRPLWFPRVLGHRCLTKPPGFAFSHDETAQMNALSCHRQRWSCSSVITVDEAACRAAETVVAACGMDPGVATVEEMDCLDARVECLKCRCRGELDASDGPGYHIVFGWRSAVKHQCERHPSLEGEWRMLSADEVDVVRDREDGWERGMRKGMIPADQKVWLCLHCVDLPGEESWKVLGRVRDHVRVCHGIERPQVNIDYVKDFAAPQVYATSILSQATKVYDMIMDSDSEGGDPE